MGDELVQLSAGIAKNLPPPLHFLSRFFSAAAVRYFGPRGPFLGQGTQEKLPCGNFTFVPWPPG